MIQLKIRCGMSMEDSTIADRFDIAAFISEKHFEIQTF